MLDEEEADPKMAMLGEPIIGVERVVYDDKTGPGAIPAKPLPTPKSMSSAQRAVHEVLAGFLSVSNLTAWVVVSGFETVVNIF